MGISEAYDASVKDIVEISGGFGGAGKQLYRVTVAFKRSYGFFQIHFISFLRAGIDLFL